MIRRNCSDPTFSHVPFVSTENHPKQGSDGDLRQYSSVGENWNEVKRRFADALAHDRLISRETERENMHFYLSEMLISVIEKLSWREEVEELEESGNLFNVSEIPDSPLLDLLRPTNSIPSANQNDELHAGSSTFYASVGDIDRIYEDSTTSRNEVGNGLDFGSSAGCSAEATASLLLKLFSTTRLPDKFEDAQWLVSYAQAPHLLLHLPKELSSHLEELDDNGRPIRLRGSAEWAPPRKQWIFSLTLNQLSLKQMLELQNNLCAGCGMKVSKVYARRMQLCNYYNKLFCQRCHQGAKMRIPARIIHQWNFREFPVSDIARRFLLDNYSQPVINALAIDPNFYERFKSLRHIRVLRLQLVHLWSFIRLCSIAKSTVTVYGNLHAMYSSIPKHLLTDADVFSMVDLDDAKNGSLTRLIEPLVRYGKCHVSNCELCQAKGFVCELCDQRDDLLFPFQLTKVDRCGECGSLSHAKCAAKRIKQSLPCPKCVRIALNSARHRQHSETSTAQKQ